MDNPAYHVCNQRVHPKYGVEQDAWDFRRWDLAINLVTGDAKKPKGPFEEIAFGKYFPLDSYLEQSAEYSLVAGGKYHISTRFKYDAVGSGTPLFGLLMVVAKGNLGEGLGIIYDSTPTRLPSAGLGFAHWNGGGTWWGYTIFSPSDPQLNEFNCVDVFYSRHDTISIWLNNVEIVHVDKSGDPHPGAGPIKSFIGGSKTAANDLSVWMNWGSFGGTTA